MPPDRSLIEHLPVAMAQGRERGRRAEGRAENMVVWSTRVGFKGLGQF